MFKMMSMSAFHCIFSLKDFYLSVGKDHEKFNKTDAYIIHMQPSQFSHRDQNHCVNVIVKFPYVFIMLEVN